MNEDQGPPTDEAVRALDLEVLFALRGALGDDELVVQLVEIFLRDTPAQLATLTAAVESGDVSTASETAHLVKGSALTFGATRLADLCDTLEQPGNPDPATAVSLVVAEYDRAAAALADYLETLS